MWQIFELDNLGLRLNLEKIWKLFGKNYKRKIWGKNYDISISFSEFLKMLGNFGHSRYHLYVETIPTSNLECIYIYIYNSYYYEGKDQNVMNTLKHP